MKTLFVYSFLSFLWNHKLTFINQTILKIINKRKLKSSITQYFITVPIFTLNWLVKKRLRVMFLSPLASALCGHYSFWWFGKDILLCDCKLRKEVAWKEEQWPQSREIALNIQVSFTSYIIGTTWKCTLGYESVFLISGLTLSRDRVEPVTIHIFAFTLKMEGCSTPIFTD